MATGFRTSAGVDFDDVFDPYVQGTKPAATGYRTSDGADLAGRYAPLSYGQQAPATGYRLSSGADLNTLWAKKGSAIYALPFDGAAYYEHSQTRGAAGVAVEMGSDGAYTVTTNNSGRAPVVVTEASGRWLPSGESAANWSVQYVLTIGKNVIGTGSVDSTNDAPSAASLSTTRNASVTANAHLTGDNASADGTIAIKLYRSGALRSTTTISFNLSADGN